MPAATLSDLQTWITTYVGPILDSAMLIADMGPQGVGSPPTVPNDASKRTNLTELVNRINVARAAGALPAAYTGARSVSPPTVNENWITALGSWTAGIGSAAYQWPPY